jgi:hypothetical protein
VDDVLPRFIAHLAYRSAIATVVWIAAQVAPRRPRLAVHLLSTTSWTIGLGWAALVIAWTLRGRGPGARILSLEAGMPAGGIRLPPQVAAAGERIDAELERRFRRERATTP